MLPFYEKTQHSTGFKIECDIFGQSCTKSSGQWLKTHFGKATVDQSVRQTLKKVENIFNFAIDNMVALGNMFPNLKELEDYDLNSCAEINTKRQMNFALTYSQGFEVIC